MTFLIESMLDEMEGAETYYKAACDEAAGTDGRRTFKDLASQELAHFERLAMLYSQKLRNEPLARGDAMMTSNDIWLKYFKHKAEKLKAKINEL